MKVKFMNAALGLMLSVSCLFNIANAGLITFDELSYNQVVAFNHYQSEGLILDSSISWSIYNNSSYPKSLINETVFAGDLVGEFTSLVSSVSILMGDIGGDLDSGRLEVYDTLGQLIGSNFVTNNSWFTVSVSTQNIASFRVFSTGAVVYDTISFDSQVNEVPEPSTLAIFALGMIGLASRRFKKQS